MGDKALYNSTTLFIRGFRHTAPFSRLLRHAGDTEDVFSNPPPPPPGVLMGEDTDENVTKGKAEGNATKHNRNDMEITGIKEEYTNIIFSVSFGLYYVGESLQVSIIHHLAKDH